MADLSILTLQDDQALLAERLAHYGLPPRAGLRGLLAHIQSNHDLAMAFKDTTIQTLKNAVEEAGRA